jgi:hypothetical protein
MKGYQMYKIDLATLLQLFEEFQRSGVFTAEIPRGTLGLKEPGLARVEVINGMVVNCVILGRDGRYLSSGTDALRKLHQMGGLKWLMSTQTGSSPVVETSPLRSLPPAPLPAPRVTGNLAFHALIPMRLAAMERGVMNRLTPMQRRVLVLVDGSRSITKIAALLSVRVEIVQGTLRELEAMGLIMIGQ